jgi:hypothetical protein
VTGFSMAQGSRHDLIVAVTVDDYSGPGSYEFAVDGFYLDAKYLETSEMGVLDIDSAGNGSVTFVGVSKSGEKTTATIDFACEMSDPIEWFEGN